MAFPSNIDRRIAELLDIVDRDFEVNVSSDVQELLRGLLEIRRLAAKADVDLQYIEPKVAFALGTDWTTIPTIPTTALRASYEIEAVSTDDVVGRLSTDTTPDTTDANEWMLVNWQASVLDTRQEIVDFKAKRSANTTSCIVRVAFYG
jgi:hypothetical protein